MMREEETMSGVIVGEAAERLMRECVPLAHLREERERALDELDRHFTMELDRLPDQMVEHMRQSTLAWLDRIDRELRRRGARP